MRILALDLSLTATGVASPTGELHTVKPDPRRGPERLCWIRDQLGDQVRAGVDLCVLEGYSYGSAYSHAHALGELGGVIRCLLHELHTGWVEVPPACLKLYACGKGNASKDQVLVAVVKRLGVQPLDSNQGDAAWLRAMAADVYNRVPPAVPSGHRRVLAKVAWPDVGGWRPFPPGWKTPG